MKTAFEFMGFESEEEIDFFIERVVGSGDKYDTDEKYQAAFEQYKKENENK